MDAPLYVPFDAGLYRFWFFGKTVSGSVGIPVSRSSRIFLSRSTSSRSLPIRRSFWAMTVATGIEDFRSGIRRGSV